MEHKVILETLSNEDYESFWDQGTRDPMVVETALLRSLVLRLPQKYRDIYHHCIVAQDTQTSIGAELGYSQTHINYSLDRITEYLTWYVDYLNKGDLHHLIPEGKRSKILHSYLDYPDAQRVAEIHNLSPNTIRRVLSTYTTQSGPLATHLQYLTTAPRLFREAVREWN